MSAPASSHKSRKDAILAAALAWFASLYRKDGWAALEAAVADAIRSGMAEGEASALALAASRQGTTGFAIDLAFADAYARLTGNPAISRQASDVAARMVRGAAADLSVKLAPMAADDDSEGEIAEAAGGTVAGDNVRTVNSWLSDTLWGAAGTGAMALYQRVTQSGQSGMVMVSWITESVNPCALCLANQAGSPYAPQDVPSFPGHPNCRCELDTASDIPSSFFAAYLLS
jgi:hypothetical protein